jgi:mannosyltransferase OCH1-like enzyme
MMSKIGLSLSCMTHRSLKRALAWLPILLVVVFVLFIISRLLAFAQLFGKLGPHAGIEVTQTQVLAAHTAVTPDPRKPVVPKILHQIFHNWKNASDNTLPEDWAKMRQMCVDRNPDWEFKMWDVENSQTFIEDVFSWFLPTYLGYKYAIQRVDTMRYFALRYYGGIYLDLDNVNSSSLFPHCR